MHIFRFVPPKAKKCMYDALNFNPYILQVESVGDVSIIEQQPVPPSDSTSKVNTISSSVQQHISFPLFYPSVVIH